MNNKERQELALWAVEFAKKKGASEVAASIDNSRSSEVEVREQKIEVLKESTTNGLSLSIYRDNKYSSHSTNNLDKKGLEKFIAEAVEATKYLSADEFRSLPDASLYPKDLSLDLQLEDENYSKVSPEQRLKFAMEIEKIALSKNDKIISATGGYWDSYSESVLVHSNGLVAERASTFFGASGSVTVMDGTARPSGSNWGGGRQFSQIPSSELIGSKAVEDATRKIGQSKIASGKYDMLIENRTAGRLLSMFFRPMQARALQQKSSYLDGMLGKQIASPLLTLIDDPLLKGGFGSRLYDGQGIACKQRTMIEKGVLKEYYIDNYYGKKLGMTPNGGSASNIRFELGTRGFDAIVSDVNKGIFVTSFNGGNSNATTGDFSFGVSGFLVEGGKIVKPVNEMNISGNAKEFWNKLSELGNDPYQYSSLLSPTLVFKDIDFSGL
ncbi:TldD/PmbA family protein [Carboxylicivirga sp. M1479]|uniref:TldD/PmbA family protein n=1 Tax=Carboxylicivirga sp. M1479 TaxID=2594476 RepID=UPI00163D4894|nr:TldD/PmbA family protein [Carboxylicivirga sp. M1479]